MLYRIADIFFLVFHSLLILFNLFGWIWEKTVKWNLVTLLITASSWLFLGIITGSMGYCPLTDWHFRILEKMGISDLPVSYIKYLSDRLTGTDINESLINTVTLWGLVIALILSLYFNYRRWRRKSNKKSASAS